MRRARSDRTWRRRACCFPLLLLLAAFAVAPAEARLVAVGGGYDSGTIMSSQDGANWTRRVTALDTLERPSNFHR